MSKDSDHPQEDSPPSPANGDPASTALSIPQVDQKLDAVLAKVPEPQRNQIRTIIHEVVRDSFTAVVQGGGPRMDPETAKIITASIDKDNDNKFQYLTQQQKDEAEAGKRQHEFAVIRHGNRTRMMWPCLIAILITTIGCISVGIYLAATGREMLGSNILTAIITALLSFLGGLGTAHFFKE